MTARKLAPIWAITSATLNDGYDGPASVIYRLFFSGEFAAELSVIYGFVKVNGKTPTTTCSISFEPGHEGNDGAYVMCLALKALYDNQTTQRERTGGSEDFEFPYEAFEFAGSLLTFEY